MKHLKIVFAVCVAVVVLLGGCRRPKIIPDDKLSDIFRDAYVANAYLNTFGRGNDTLDVYSPIFKKYGYTATDVQYTIGNFSKRKSARLADIVSAALDRIDAERMFYAERVAVLDTLKAKARRRFVKEVYSDTLISVKRVADTAGLLVRIPVREAGEFEVSYRYTVDSLDKNPTMRTRHYVLNKFDRHLGENIHRMRRNNIRGSYTGRFTAGPECKYLELNLNPYPDGKIDKPNFRIDTLVVKLYLDDVTARDSLVRSFIHYPISPYYRGDIKRWNDSLRRADSLQRVSKADTLNNE